MTSLKTRRRLSRYDDIWSLITIAILHRPVIGRTNPNAEPRPPKICFRWCSGCTSSVKGMMGRQPLLWAATKQPWELQMQLLYFLYPPGLVFVLTATPLQQLSVEELEVQSPAESRRSPDQQPLIFDFKPRMFSNYWAVHLRQHFYNRT